MTSNTRRGASRRERMRAETIAEIKASARGQLLEHGPSGISLRAVARDVGVSPAALYRYFDGLESLLTDLCCDFYDELIGASEAAMDAHPPDHHLERMKAWVWTFRSWVVAHRREFELMLDTPTGSGAFAMRHDWPDLAIDQFPPLMAKSIRHSQLCGHQLAAFYRQNRGAGSGFADVEPPELSEGLQGELLQECSAMIIGEELPLNWVYAFTSAWVRVFGLVTMEAFGSLPVTENIDEFYKVQIMSMMRDFGLER